MAKKRLRKTAVAVLAAIGGGAAAIAFTALLTLIMSLAICLGLHPETVAAEWAAPVLGLVLAGALVRRFGIAATVGAGVVVGLAWAGAWFWFAGRFDVNMWMVEALPSVTWIHILAWVSAPLLSALGGFLGNRLGKRKYGSAAFYLAAPVIMLLAMLFSVARIDDSGSYALARGAVMTAAIPDPEGTTFRILTFDFASNPNLQMGIYDCDSDDSKPYDDTTTSYFAVPALTVFEKLGPGTLCVGNAGFFTWTEKGRIGSHVAPLVIDGKAHYNVFGGSELWTFGWKMVEGKPDFRLLRDVPFKQLEEKFDWAIGHARPLVVDGKALELKPGAGVTRLRCSRMSLGWKSGAGKLHVLVVREPDGEKASIAKWKTGEKQEGGWDLLEVQRYWMHKGVDQALALDGGDSTQLVYNGQYGVTNLTSGRLSFTLGYWRDRPLRVWIPILPTRHSDAGVINYWYVRTK